MNSSLVETIKPQNALKDTLKFLRRGLTRSEMKKLEEERN